MMSEQDKINLRFRELFLESKPAGINKLINHYLFLARKKGIASEKLSKSALNPKSKIHFDRVLEICFMKGWEPKLYLESQFQRAEKSTKFDIPPVKNLYSESAIKYFVNFLNERRKTYEKDVYTRYYLKPLETMSLTEEVINGVYTSIDNLSMYLKDDMCTSENKALRIYHMWEQLSPYYLYTIKWFHKVLPSLDSLRARELENYFLDIDMNSRIRELAEETVADMEKEYNFPPNIKL